MEVWFELLKVSFSRGSVLNRFVREAPNSSNKSHALSCLVHFLTAWDPDDAVDEVYELLSTLIDNCTRHGRVPVVGGDFNAQIGALQPSDDAACVGVCGHGCRSARGKRFVHWVLMHGLIVLNRQLDENLADDNWTCKRALDGTLVQIDFVLSDSRMFVDNVWNDDMVAVGVDHRCVHCVLRFPGWHVRREAHNKSLKSWVPFLNAAGEPSLYRNVLILNWHWWTTLLVVKLKTLGLLLGTWVGSPVVGASSSSRLVIYIFFFPRTFFSRRVWLELFYWAASRHVPFLYRRLRMCRETGPSPSHCSLGAGWDTAGGWGEGGFGQHLTGKGLVTRDAVKFQETGRIGGHSCMGDLGRPPVDQGIRE